MASPRTSKPTAVDVLPDPDTLEWGESEEFPDANELEWETAPTPIATTKAVPPEVTPATPLPEPTPEPERRYPIPAPGRPLLMALGGKEMEDALTFTPSALPAAVRGINNQYTRGMSDEIMGRVGAAFPRLTLPTVADVFNPSVPTPPQRSYESLRDEMRGLEAKSAEEHPGAYYGAPLALAAVTGNAAGAKQSAGALSRLWRSGAAQGGLSGFGNSTADLTGPGSGAGDYVNAALNTLGGAAIGKVGETVFPLLAEKIPAVAGRAQKWLSDKAEERALKSVTGNNLRLWQQLIPGERFREIGRDLLDQGVVTKGVSVADARKRAEAVAETARKDINQSLSDVDALIPEDARPWSYDIAKDIKERMVLPRRTMTAGDDVVANRLEAEANKFRDYKFPLRPTLTRMEQQKRGLDQFIDHEAQKMKPVQDGLDDLRDYLANNVEQDAWRAAEGAGSDAAKRFIESKRLSGNMLAVAAPSIKQTARELSNRYVSPSDYGAGAAAALMAGQGGDNPVASGLKGAAFAAANKLARERGNQVAAVGLNNLSDSDMLWKAIRANPTTLGDAAESMSHAFSGGPSAFAVQDYLLTQGSPGYEAWRRKPREDDERRALADYLRRRQSGSGN